MKTYLLFVAFFIAAVLPAQTYAPPAGQLGTIAMHKDSSAFVSWANICTVKRGYLDISNKALGFASTGDSSMALGKALANAIVSLGDGGEAICRFAHPIRNGAGYDFAVFENSFDDTFLELAFVEVSSDGINFFRFASHSLTDTLNQTGPFGSTDATKLNNLAGKYRGGYGTPFDLQELANKPGLNINAITHVKIIDVVGSVTQQYATRDSYGNKINDPWPTSFPSGGFDLDAVGVIHQNLLGGVEDFAGNYPLSVSPNPVANGRCLYVNAPGFAINKIELMNLSGEVLVNTTHNKLLVENLSTGLHILKISTDKGIGFKKIIIH